MSPTGAFDAEGQVGPVVSDSISTLGSGNLHSGFLARVDPAALKANARAQLGRYGRGKCWKCTLRPGDDTDGTTVDDCNTATRAVRCALDSGRTGRAALQRCGREPF